MRYDYFNGGEVKSRTDNQVGVIDHFTYDGFDQLSTWTSAGNGEIYVYDGLGNQLTNGDAVSAFGSTGFSPHQIASRTEGSETRTFQYDPLGRQTLMQINGVTTHKVEYTPFNLPRKVQISAPLQGFPNHFYSYDADQQKVHEDDGTFETTYVGSLYERRVNKATCKVDDVFYVFAEGQRVTQVVQSHDGTSCLDSNTGETKTNLSPNAAVETITALHSDLHGTVTASTTVGASPTTKRQAFSPWGSRVPVSAGGVSTAIDKVTVGFTDQEHDDTVGLVNMRGRVYDPITRTFLTPDPIVSAPLKVSGWNKYAYVLNNPLKYSDPSGFSADDGTLDSQDVIDGIEVNQDAERIFIDTPILVTRDSSASVAPTTPESFDPGSISDFLNAPAVVSLVPGTNPTPDIGGSPCGDGYTCGDPPGLSAINNSSNLLNHPDSHQDRIDADIRRDFEYEKGGLTSVWYDPSQVLPGLFTGKSEIAISEEVIEEVASATSACAGGVCPCFVAGTAVDTDHGSKMIEAISLGDRVGPELSDCSTAAVSDWREVDLSMTVLNDGALDELSIHLLRPEAWLREHHASVGSSISVALDDLNVSGEARVTRIGGTYPITPGTRCPVTGLVQHVSHDVSSLSLEGERNPLGVTRQHRFFSLDRSDWVHASELQIGEVLQTKTGSIRVNQVMSAERWTAPVFNLEVFGAHQYFVGGANVLTHNQYFGAIDTSLVRFTQDTVSSRFSTGQTLNETISALSGPEGDAVASKIPAIRVFESEGQLYTLDNRRLLVFSQAGRQIPYTLVDSANSAIAREIFQKATTTAVQGWGQFVTVLP